MTALPWLQPEPDASDWADDDQETGRTADMARGSFFIVEGRQLSVIDDEFVNPATGIRYRVRRPAPLQQERATSRRMAPTSGEPAWSEPGSRQTPVTRIGRGISDRRLIDHQHHVTRIRAEYGDPEAALGDFMRAHFDAQAALAIFDDYLDDDDVETTSAE